MSRKNGWGGRAAVKARAYWADRLPQPCWRCGRMIEPGAPAVCRRGCTDPRCWDVGHPVDLAVGGDPELHRPEHRHRSSTCRGNRSAGATLGHALAGRGQAQPRRDWTIRIPPADPDVDFRLEDESCQQLPSSTRPVATAA